MQLFQYYDDLRRPRIDAAVKEANFGFQTIQDRGWLATLIMEWLTWLFLLYRRSHREHELAFDVREIPLDF
jgi:salicylate hydroxylase